jgi:mono/diheme cytochrome c family protein
MTVVIRAARVLGMIAVVCIAGCDVDLERMLDQKRYDPYEPSEHFEDGMAMRTPPIGTVPRSRPMGPEPVMQGVEDGELVERIPVEVSLAMIERGRNRYEIFCAPCHGMLGNSATWVAANMTIRPPPSLHEPRLREYPPGRMYQVITGGYGLMRSYATELSISDRWAVVAYVQALQLSQYAVLDGLPAELRKEADSWLK